MKKLMAAILSLTIICGLTACGSESENSETGNDVSVTETTQTTTAEASETTVETTATTTVKETTKADTTASETTTASKKTEKETKKTETKAAEQNIDFKAETSEFAEDFDKILIDIAKSKGLNVSYNKETLSFSAPQSVLKEIAAEYRTTLNKKLDGTDVSDEETVKKAVISKDYKTLEVYVADNADDTELGMSALLLSQPMYELQLLTGGTKDSCKYVQKTININSGKVLGTYTMPDDLDM